MSDKNYFALIFAVYAILIILVVASYNPKKDCIDSCKYVSDYSTCTSACIELFKEKK